MKNTYSNETKLGKPSELEMLIEKHNQEILSLMDREQELRMKMAETKAKMLKAREKEEELYNLWLRN